MSRDIYDSKVPFKQLQETATLQSTNTTNSETVKTQLENFGKNQKKNCEPAKQMNNKDNGENENEKAQQDLEIDEVEKKIKLLKPSDDRQEQLSMQMQWRLTEGNGEAFYEIGIEGDGTPQGLDEAEMKKSIDNLQEVAKKIGATCNVLRIANGLNGKIADVLIRKSSEENYLEIRVAVVGNVDAGKSTTLGVLTHSDLDNGRGKARANIFRHQHELDSGRTSSVCSEIMGFDVNGKIINYDVRGTNTSDIAKQSCKIINFSDLAGHEKYFKTTLFGMSGRNPDYVMLLVGANMGCVGMTKEHLGCSLALRVPIFVVITKIDLAPENVFKETMSQIQKMLKSPGVKKIPLIIKTIDDVINAARQISSGRITPIFCISNVSGENVDLLRKFLNFLPSTEDWASLANDPLHFVIDNDWSVPGVGTVVAGTIQSGQLVNNETYLLGPNEFGVFVPAQIKSVHINRLPVKSAKAGMTASVSLKKIERKQIRKGMILVHPSVKPTSCLEFEAEVVILYHSTTMAIGYEAVVHCGAVRQTARLIKMEKAHLRTGDKANVTFRFNFFPEYLINGSRIIFREGRAKGIGRVLSSVPYIAQVTGSKTNPKKRTSSGPTALMSSFPPLPAVSNSSFSLVTTAETFETPSPDIKRDSDEENNFDGETDKLPTPQTVKGFYVKDTKTGIVRCVFSINYTLLEHEVFWEKELPREMEELIQRKGRRANASSLKQRNKTFLVSVSFPHISAVKIINSETNEQKVIFSHQQCYLEPHDNFFAFSLSGGRPKIPNQKRTIRLIINPSYMTDIIPCSTSDGFNLFLKISYNYRFSIEPRTCSQEDALLLFSIPDFVGYVCSLFNPKIKAACAALALVDFSANAVKVCEEAVFGTEKTVVLPNKLLINSVNLVSVEGDEAAKKELAKLPPIVTSKQAKQQQQQQQHQQTTNKPTTTTTTTTNIKQEQPKQ